MWKCRFGGFRHRWFQIWWSRIEIRDHQIWKSKSKFRFWCSDFDVKIEIEIQVLMFRFWCENADFLVLGIDFEFLSPNFKIEIEIQVLMFRFLIFSKPNFSKIEINFWQNRFLHFDQNLTQNFDFDGSIYRFFSRISINTRNIFQIFAQRAFGAIMTDEPSESMSTRPSWVLRPLESSRLIFLSGN